MKIDACTLRFGGLTFSFTGWVREAEYPYLIDPFRVPPAPADLHVEVYQASGTDVPDDAQLIKDDFAHGVFQKGEQLWVQFRSYQDRGMWTFAVLHVDLRQPDELKLQILHPNCRFSLETILSSVMMESQLLRHGRAVLHAATIDVGGEAICFSAPSGTGKSTQAELWRRHRGAEVINGDRILLRNQNGIEYACGLPFAGTSEICKNRELPLRAIVLLSQAKENRLERVGQMPAVKHLLSQIAVQKWSSDDISSALSIASRLAQTVPIYHLACLPDESAVEILEQELYGERTESYLLS